MVGGAYWAIRVILMYSVPRHACYRIKWFINMLLCSRSSKDEVVFSLTYAREKPRFLMQLLLFSHSVLSHFYRLVKRFVVL